MKRLLFIFLLLAVGPRATASDSIILVLGDSISAGYGITVEESWVSLLQKRLDSQGYGYRVVNASISGDTTGGGVARLGRALSVHEPDILIVELGGNDGLRGISVAEIRGNLSAMIGAALESGTEVVLAGMQMPPNYGSRYADSFRAVYPELAREYAVTLVPFILENVAMNPELMQPDGFHPNAAGQAGVLENVWTGLEQIIGRDR